MEEIVFDERELNYLGLTGTDKSNKKVFLVLSANYGNVGDIGITIAQKKVLKNIFPDRKIIEVPMINFYDYEKLMRKIVNDDDIITIVGGGNIGNIYPLCEEYRRFIIENYPNNKIFSFPQSIFFEDNDFGKSELEKTINVYNNHPNLTIFVREDRSYNKMKEIFKNDVILVPDIVLSLKNLNISKEPRHTVSICLRHDIESAIPENTFDVLKKSLKKHNITDTTAISTHMGNITINSCDEEKHFYDLLEKFAKSKVVITDRLHGMIFSIITNTPCIVFDNSNHKISATYKTWLKDFKTVKFLEDYDDEKIQITIDEIMNCQEHIHDFDHKFEPLFNKLKEN